ncbi:DUF6602 domain-containing protein [Kribbella pratensis]|uniref:DUF6602 domain-containing protein n=1 Tax=Kribbella pratensis TaxID=2512112 RepID=UPI001066D150|nr:DUF6602 domain-containing protein [Kribbella pratensis]
MSSTDASGQGKLPEILRASAKKLQGAFEETAHIRHRGARGASREDPIRIFLSERMPRTVSVLGSSEVVSVDGRTSGQCDILISDPVTPPFLVSDSHQVVPVECVFGVIEVKSRLTKKEVLNACDQIARVKDLPKTAYYADTGLRGPAHADAGAGKQTAGYVFAYTSTISMGTLARHVVEWCERHDPNLWPDGIYVLDKGSLLWSRRDLPFNLIGSPVPGTELVFLKPNSPGDVILTAVFQLYIRFVNSWMPPIDIAPYMSTSLLGVRHFNRSPAPEWPNESDASGTS